MSVKMEEIESNFSKFDGFKLVHKQDYYIVSFKIEEQNINIHISKELEYLFVESNDINFSELNTKLIFDKKLPSIKDYIDNLSNPVIKDLTEEYDDIYGIFRDREVCNKGKCNFDNIAAFLKNSNLKSYIGISKIPKNLLYPTPQIIDIIIKEMKKVNSNKSHPHFIVSTDDPYVFNMNINLKDSDKNPLNIILTMEIDPQLYPFIPPKVKYVSPSAKRSLIYNLSNINVLQIENWNPTISFDWLITSLADNLNRLKSDYICNNDEENIMEIDKYIVEFSTLIGERLYNDIDLDFDYVKFSLTNTCSDEKKNKYWNSGVGYGGSGRNEWDIKKYVKDTMVKNKNISNILKKVTSELHKSSESVTRFTKSLFMKYIKNSICNTTLLEINKNKVLYNSLLALIKDVFPMIGDEYNSWKYEIHKGFESIRQDISPLLGNIIEEELMPYYINIISVADFVNIDVEEININKDNTSAVKQLDTDVYSQMIKDEQSKIFSNYTIESTHRFHSKKSSNLNPKSLMRISSEFSSLKKNLPINWDTSIVVRASSDNLNIFSFVITGPKDTPYHNGVYEFHAYFPENYPNSEPKVLLDTTGGGKVRFNPNLYNCGKVCLSLLGTWSGQDGESWNKDTSTFLQVLISIQSLILVEKPYFNEPGWERDMHTERGKELNFNYNDNIRLQNMRWAIVDKLKNPAKGFESLIKQHFMLKQNEILETTQKWIDESKKYKTEMTDCRNEFIKLLSNKESFDEYCDKMEKVIDIIEEKNNEKNEKNKQL